MTYFDQLPKMTKIDQIDQNGPNLAKMTKKSPPDPGPGLIRPYPDPPNPPEIGPK